MDSLTRKQNIVSDECKGIFPKRGHSLVVYELIDKTQEFVAVVDDGKQFVKPKDSVLPFFRKERIYISYAVKNTPFLDYNFQDMFHHKSIGHNFYLDFSLRYKIFDPRTIVDQLSNDPLNNVITNIKVKIGAQASIYEWDNIIEQKSRDNCLALMRTAVNSEWKNICDDALIYGIELISLSCLLNLTKADEEIYIESIKAANQTQIIEIATKQAIETLKLKTEQELAELKGKCILKEYEVEADSNLKTKRLSLDQAHNNLVHAVNIDNAQHDTAVNQLKRYDFLQDQTIKAFITSITNIADNVRDSGDLQRHVDNVTKIFKNLSSSGYQHEESSTKKDALPSGQTLGSRESELVAILNEAIETLGPLPKENPASRALIAATLHLLAEIYLDADKNEEKVQSYVTQVRVVCQKLNIESDEQLYRFIQSLYDVDKLKNKFN